jgi:hypothetical protein
MKERLLAAELYKYLLLLASQLEGIGDTDAAQRVLHVSRFASGSTSELYGEARLLLPSLLRELGNKLSEFDAARLRDTIAGIEREFSEIGGG